MFEEWIASPSKHAYVHQASHSTYASRPGWWSTGKLMSIEQVRARGFKPLAYDTRGESLPLEDLPAQAAPEDAA